jgi:glycosyltransferase involved in cell wall biosynthesis
MAGPLIAQGVEEWRIVWVPNGVDTNLFEAPTREPRAGVTLVYAGAHGPANRLGTVLEAAKLLQPRSEIRFVLIGDGSEKSRLEAQAHAWGLSNLSFLPPVPKDRLQQVFAAADAGLMVLMPSPLFAMGASPNKLFDYLACGLPVVSNVPGEIATLIRDSGAGEQAADGSGEGLAAAIARLADRTPEERIALGAAGRSWVVQERDRDQLATRLEDALVSALAEGEP